VASPKKHQASGAGGKGSTAGGAGHGVAAHENHGIGRYVLIWVILMVLTVVTVVTGKMTANIYLAMGIAITKATLVVLFFMHLWDEGGVNRMVFVVSLTFVAVLLLFTFGDLMTRNPMTLPNEGPQPYRATSGSHEAAPPAAH
jgi:caa(3)-type oxidase subunit IV